MRNVVADASAVVALLVGAPPLAEAAIEAVSDAHLFAPDVLPFEVANTLRRLELSGAIDPTASSLALTDALSLPVDYWPFDALSERIWQLRHHVTSHDASYVALAEELAGTLLTADLRLAATHGLRCAVRTLTAR